MTSRDRNYRVAPLIFIIIIAISLLLSIPTWKHAAASPPIQTMRLATQDSYIDPSRPKDILGLRPYINASAGPSNQSIIFLKFDLSGLPPRALVINVTLTLWLVNSTQTVGDQIGAYGESNNSWLQSSLTYENAPRSNITLSPLDTQLAAFPTTTWNVTALVRPLIGVNSTINTPATIVLQHSGPPPITPSMVLFRSTENGSQQPTLTVSYKKYASKTNLSPYTTTLSTIYNTPVVLSAVSEIVVNATLNLPANDGITAIQFSADNNRTWSNIISGPPDSTGTVVAIWIPPVAGTYFIRSTWSGDAFTDNSTSQEEKLIVAPASTSTSIIVSASAIGYGNQTLIIATLRPQLSEGIMRVEKSTDSGVNWVQLFSVTPVNGVAFQSFSPPLTGNYLFRATWLGDNNYNASSSTWAGLVVSKAPTTLTFSVSQTILDVRSSNLVSGFLKATGGAAISGAKVVIQISPSSSSSQSPVFTDFTTLTTGIDGSFAFPWIPQTNGTYQLRAYFAGNPNYNTSYSRVLAVLVGVPIFPTAGQIGLISGLLGFFIGLGLSFLIRFRRSVGVKRRQRYGGTKTKGEQPQR